MATTLSSSTLTVKLTESILLNGIDQGGTNTLAISGIKQVHKRIITMPFDDVSDPIDAAERKLLHISSSRAAGQYVVGDIRYVRITNLDNSVAVNIRLQGANFADTTITGATYNNQTAITHSSNSAVELGMSVTGDGIPEGARVASITSNTAFVLSAATTGGLKENKTLALTAGFKQRLDPGCSMLFTSSSTTGLVGYAKNENLLAGTLEDLTEIHAETTTAACDLELFIATV